MLLLHKTWKKIIAGSLIAVALSSCATVKPYERAYLNDQEMQVGTSASAQFEDYYQSIREGSVPSGNAKTSDGCGCK
jgi:hypothetical protein